MNHLHNIAICIEKNCVEKKTHETGMNGITRGKEQPLSRRESAPSQQAAQTLANGVGNRKPFR